MTALERESLRYLACPAPDEETLSALRGVIDEVRRASRFRHAALEMPVTDDPLAAMIRDSRDLTRLLEGCGRAVIAAATLGPGPDTLVRRYEATDLRRAGMAQAAGAALIEEELDRLPGEGLTARFSPGYGDLGLGAQRPIFALLEVSKRLGVSLTKDLIMIPLKSVTYIQGVRPGATRPVHHCAACESVRCPYRKGD